jgi:hypothetical protein
VGRLDLPSPFALGEANAKVGANVCFRAIADIGPAVVPLLQRILRLTRVDQEERNVDFLFVEWLGTPAWFWLSFLGLVIALTAFDLGILHKEDREMGIGESLKLSAFYIGVALLFGAWIWFGRGS